MQSVTANSTLTAQARDSLRGNWGKAIAAYVILLIISFIGAIPIVGFIISLIISGPLMLGISTFFTKLLTKNELEISDVFSGFNRFSTGFSAYFLMIVFILLWTLLLIIPGIIAGLSYSQTFFILANDPKISASDALSCSKSMMRGNRWKLFCLGLRFFGWGLLCLLTFGIGLLWLGPYMFASYAAFYQDVRKGDNQATA